MTPLIAVALVDILLNLNAVPDTSFAHPEDLVGMVHLFLIRSWFEQHGGAAVLRALDFISSYH